MTSEQKAWLDGNPEYQVIGVIGGNTRFVERGALNADGTFERARKPDAGKAAFEVGKLRGYTPGRPLDTFDPKGTTRR